MATIAQTPNTRRRIPTWLIVGVVVLLVVLLGLAVLNAQNLFNAGDSALQFIFNPNRIDPGQIVQCRDDSGCSTIQAIVFSLIFFFVILTGFAYTTLLERKFIAFFQQRVGPNRVGPAGLLQPLADAIKLIFKEDITPSGANKAVYLLAPLLKAVPALLLLAVVPLGPDLLIPGGGERWFQVPLGLADPNVGVLWLLGVTSIGTYGVVLAGWSSNNKYSMLGGLRASAQMLSYELSLGLTMAVPVIIVSSMSVGDIMQAQTYVWQWFIFQNPLAAGILAIALLAEISRAPFDLPEAEQELTQGFMTEYSGMKFASFMMAEYLGMIGISIVWSALFFGGYNDGFGLVNNLPFLGPLVFIGKTLLFLIVMVWIRATLPRLRYDRLMAFGWKVMLPLALVAVMWTSVAVLIADTVGSTLVYGIIAGLVFVAVVGGGYLLLRQAGELDDDTPESLEDDPIITGEKRGLGYAALQVVGGLLSVPFVLFKVTMNILRNLAQLAPEPSAARDQNDVANRPTAGGNAIVPSESSAD